MDDRTLLLVQAGLLTVLTVALGILKNVDRKKLPRRMRSGRRRIKPVVQEDKTE